MIKSPHENETFEVDLGELQSCHADTNTCTLYLYKLLLKTCKLFFLGSTKVINCTADLYSDFDVVFWLVGDTFVETNNSSSVFYNFTR